jgi:hypothetical protein
MIFQQGVLSLLDVASATSCWFQGSTHIEKDKIISVNSIIRAQCIKYKKVPLFLYFICYGVLYSYKTANHVSLLVNNKISHQTNMNKKY